MLQLVSFLSFYYSFVFDGDSVAWSPECARNFCVEARMFSYHSSPWLRRSRLNELRRNQFLYLLVSGVIIFFRVSNKPIFAVYRYWACFEAVPQQRHISLHRWHFCNSSESEGIGPGGRHRLALCNKVSCRSQRCEYIPIHVELCEGCYTHVVKNLGFHRSRSEHDETTMTFLLILFRTDRYWLGVLVGQRSVLRQFELYITF